MDTALARELLRSADPDRWRRAREDLRREGREPPPLDHEDLRGLDLSDFDLSDLQLTSALLTGSNLRGANLRGAVLIEADLIRSQAIEADLTGADLTGAYADSATWEGAVLDRVEAKGVRFREADLRGAHFRSAHLDRAVFERAVLIDAVFAPVTSGERTRMQEADFRDANIDNADFSEVDLFRSDLRVETLPSSVFFDANLTAVRLAEGPEGATSSQFSGASLDGTRIPSWLFGLEPKLKTVRQATSYSRNLLLGLLAGCFYVLLSIMTTSDADLLFGKRLESLPIVGAEVEAGVFYGLAPVLLAAVFLYLHLALRNLWPLLGDLPSVLPDGRGLHKATDPWLVTALVQRYAKRLVAVRVPSAGLQEWVVIALIWWLTPVTLSVIWLWFLRVHDHLISVIQLLTLGGSVAASFLFYSEAQRALRGIARAHLRDGVNVPGEDPFPTGSTSDVLAWLILVLIAGFGIQVLAASGAVNVFNADLRNAKLAGEVAYGSALQGADLRNADLRNADLRGSDISGADLSGALLAGADLRDTTGVDCQLLSRGVDWELALRENPCGHDIPQPRTEQLQPPTAGVGPQSDRCECVVRGFGTCAPCPPVREDRSVGEHRTMYLVAGLALFALGLAWFKISNTRLSRVTSLTASLLGAVSVGASFVERVDRIVLWDDSEHTHEYRIDVGGPPYGLAGLAQLEPVTGFEPGIEKISGRTEEIADRVVTAIESNRYSCLVAIGRTDRQAIGPRLIDRFDSNAELASARADWVRSIVLAEAGKRGVAFPVLTFVAGSEDRHQPDSETLRENNRRVDLYGCPAR